MGLEDQGEKAFSETESPDTEACLLDQNFEIFQIYVRYFKLSVTH